MKQSAIQSSDRIDSVVDYWVDSFEGKKVMAQSKQLSFQPAFDCLLIVMQCQIRSRVVFGVLLDFHPVKAI